jgi:hypothetical protein
MISAYKERTNVKWGGVVQIRCPDLQPDTMVDVIILTVSLPNDKDRENFETKKYPVSDFPALLKDGPKILLKQEKLTREWIHQGEQVVNPLKKSAD